MITLKSNEDVHKIFKSLHPELEKTIAEMFARQPDEKSTLFLKEMLEHSIAHIEKTRNTQIDVSKNAGRASSYYDK